MRSIATWYSRCVSLETLALLRRGWGWGRFGYLDDGKMGLRKRGGAGGLRFEDLVKGFDTIILYAVFELRNLSEA
jgi:hypothetical protein